MDLHQELKFHRTRIVRNRGNRAVKKVLLLNAPVIKYNEFQIDNEKRTKNISYPPLGLAYLGAVLRQESPDIEIKIVDLNFESLKVMFSTGKKDNVLENCLQEALRGFDPDLVGISVVFSIAIGNGRKIAAKVKEYDPRIIVCFGGVHCTFEYKSILSDPCADVVFFHEAENSFTHYIKFLNGESREDSVDGIGFLGEEGRVVEIPYQSFPDFDKLPLPAWDLLPTADYHRYSQFSGVKNIQDKDVPTAIIQGERGCSSRCAFCSVRNFNGKHIRARSPENILKEIDLLYHDFGVRYIDFVDDDFSYDRRRVIAICDALIQRKYDLVWTLDNGIRLVTLNEEVIEKLLGAGCRLISVGVESGNAEILRKIRKPLTLEILYEKAALLHKYPDLYVKGNFIVGFPFESDEQMEDTFRVAREVQFDQAATSIYSPLVGTDALSYSKDTEGMDIEFGNDNFGKTLIDRFNNQEFYNKVYINNLRTNFIENPNYKGRNLERALKDFLRVINTNCPDHAVAVYCVSKIYETLKDERNQKKYSERFKDIIKDSENWRFYCRQLNISYESSSIKQG
ncbi:MAG TPA: hypothetical protein DD723_10595 [Candidatus Omnitrophica bacterium]|nr:MAG: hypothetical protein A2Z81_09755 [Omnitrophica WOR_2 bacterium GWA2_45_18]HBR15965.1 hypothetical protein [Candidatus Omnitrophota bacterium]